MNRLESLVQPLVADFEKNHLAIKHAGLTFLICAFVSILFASFHLLQTRGHLASDQWLISKDGGYAEWFQYFVTLLGAGNFLQAFLSKKRLTYALCACILFYLFLDDALMLHERAGDVFSEMHFHFSVAGLSFEHSGELLYLGFAGVIILTALLFTARNTQEPGIAVAFAILFVLMGFFSAGLDGLHVKYGVSALGVIEDTGEMIISSAFAALAIFAARKAE